MGEPPRCRDRTAAPQSHPCSRRPVLRARWLNRLPSSATPSVDSAVMVRVVVCTLPARLPLAAFQRALALGAVRRGFAQGFVPPQLLAVVLGCVLVHSHRQRDRQAGQAVQWPEAALALEDLEELRSRVDRVAVVAEPLRGQRSPQHRTGNVVVHLLPEDRKSTRLNSSHVKISYAVFCLKK